MSLLFVEFLGIVVAVSLCILVTVVWHFHRQHQKYDHLPGPPRDSFWSGHIPSIAKVMAAGGIMDDYVLETSKTHGLFFRLCLWNQVVVVVLDPDCIKDVLVTGNHPKSKRIYSRTGSIFGARFLGQGLESQIDNKHWILQRMHFDQWFKPNFIRQFASEFNEFADCFTEYLETYADNKTEIHTLHSFNKLTMHLLYKVAFNIDMGSLHGENHPVVTKMKKALTGFAAQLSNPLVAVNPFKWRFRRDVQKAIHFVRGNARQEMIDRNVAKRNGDYFPHDLLEYIMDLKGQETSANTMSFMLDLLGRNPECYKKLQREIDENVGAVSVISLNEIEKLPYLDMVLKETLRLYPVGKGTFRETIKDYNLGGHLIPAGTDMMVSFYATSRAEQNVRDPTKFSPERFHIDSSEKFSKYASTPFSAGPHTCIGKKFAEIQIKITIAKIMQNFDFELVTGQSCDLADNAVLQAKDGVKCFFRPRETVSAAS
ncbi:cholesterol 24-hydroxylase-like isoform X2 [Mizuhopecten yessoensis]|uniref:cholesterol 24-hydroxylase-like isoform X2 n=1 Tax=Mizuhopecten yessoensis TaxID=6573 RepID=UPI000B45A04F|nr:cholesterol 24-hydroxylase-like isoform X2 [Mizuhopecten yessoensis]